MFKKKYIAVFLVKANESYEIIKKKRFKPTDTTVFYNSEGYPISVKTKTYSFGLNTFYFFEVDSKKQLVFLSNKDSFLGSKALDLALAKKIIPDLTMDLTNTSFKKNIQNLVLGGLIGGMLTFIISGFF